MRLGLPIPISQLLFSLKFNTICSKQYKLKSLISNAICEFSNYKIQMIIHLHMIKLLVVLKMWVLDDG